MKQEAVNNQTVLDLLYLIALALHGEKLDREMDLEQVYRLAREQSLSAMAYYPVEGTAQLAEVPELAARWKQDREMTLRKNILMDAARAEILEGLEQAGVWYLPLKGSLLKDLYPRPGMRQMADNDILFDPAGQRRMEELMSALGYELAERDPGHHDSFRKPPFYNFEMHTALFGSAHHLSSSRYYRNVRSRLLPDGTHRYGLRFSDEDFYVYFMAHAYGHYSFAGCGLRFLVDCYVYLDRKGETLDEAYISKELAKQEMADFEVKARRLARKLFSTPDEVELEPGEWAMLNDCTGVGTYGSADRRVENWVRKLEPKGGKSRLGTRMRYYLFRLWPSKELCEQYYPFFARYPIFKPVLVVYRILRSVLSQRKKLSQELRALKDMGDEK